MPVQQGIAQQKNGAARCVEMADEATLEDWQLVKLRIWARQWRERSFPRENMVKVLAEPAQPKHDEHARLPDGRLPRLMAPFKRADLADF